MTGTNPSSRPTAAAKALAAWTELNDRHQGTLAVIYSLDQAAEHEHQQRGARGDFDPRPASQWRALEFAHDPADRNGLSGRARFAFIERFGPSCSTVAAQMLRLKASGSSRTRPT
ncbi:hypothetical protein ACNF49_30835 [Actinomadura sp. ATCC 39365]